MLEGALAAEAREIHFKDTLNRSHAIDNASELKSTPAISRTNAQWSSSNKKGNKGRGKSRASFDTRQQNQSAQNVVHNNRTLPTSSIRINNSTPITIRELNNNILHSSIRISISNLNSSTTAKAQLVQDLK